MTQEEKAKAYDEALEWMREIYPTMEGFVREDAEHYFPELKESEDERIRKSLIEVFKEKLKRGFEWVEYGIPNRSVLTWLEKQKELPFVKDVMLGYPGLYFYDGERMHFQGNPAMEEKQKESLKDFIDDFPYSDEQKEQKLITTGVSFNPDDYEVVAEGNATYIKQKELPLMNGNSDTYFDEWNLQQQNPTKRQCFEEGIRYAQRLQKEQKPVEIHIDNPNIEKFDPDVKITTSDSSADRKVYCEEVRDAFEPNSNINIPEKQAEWSEEDEKTINNACCWIAEYAGYLMDKNYSKASMLMSLTDKLKSLSPQSHCKISDELDTDTLRDWSMRFAPDIREEIEATAYHFYNLRPQPHTVSVENATKFGNLEYERGVKDGTQHSENHRWKPSEEQMEALNVLNCHGGLSYVGQQNQLISLYNDLKKLK